MSISKLRLRLEEWRNDTLYPNSKSYLEKTSPIIEGEYYFTLSWNMKLMETETELIQQVKTYHTLGLTITMETVNPDGDLVRLNEKLKNWDLKFDDKIQKAILTYITKL